MKRGTATFTRPWRGFVVAAIFAAALQSFVPAGYMPSLAGGRIAFVECNGYVFAGESARAHARHHAADGTAPTRENNRRPGHSDHQGMQPCAFAVAGHFALDAPALAIAPAAAWTAVLFAPPVIRLEPRVTLAPSARGPPLFS